MNYIIQYRNNDFKNATIFLPSSASADGRVTEILQWIAKANRYFVLLRKQMSNVEGGWIYRVDEITQQGELVNSSPEEEIISRNPVKVTLEVEGDDIVMRIPSAGRTLTLNVPGEHTDSDTITGDPDPSGPSPGGGGSNSGPGGSGGHSGGGVSPLPGTDDTPPPPPPPDYSVDNVDEVIETQADRNYYIPEYINVREVIIEVIDKF